VRASRLVNVLLLLQARGGLTAGELAAELDVSVRTVYRDLEALGIAGVPVFGVAGPGGGYRLVDGYRTRLTGLTAAEAEALLLLDLSAPLRALGLGADLLAGRLKLTASLSEPVRSRATELAGRVHLDLPGWFEGPESAPALPVLTEAVLSDRQVRFRYGGPDREDGRLVEPLGLVLKGRSWYLVARRGGRMLTYAVRRISAPELTELDVERPAGFDLATTWGRLVDEFEASLPSVEVLVRASPAGLSRLPGIVDGRNRQRTNWGGEPDEDGWRRLTVTFERIEYARQGLLGLGADVEVLAPLELRDMMAAAGAALARLYSPQAVAQKSTK